MEGMEETSLSPGVNLDFAASGGEFDCLEARHTPEPKPQPAQGPSRPSKGQAFQAESLGIGHSNQTGGQDRTPAPRPPSHGCPA